MPNGLGYPSLQNWNSYLFPTSREADTNLFIAFESRVEVIDIANTQADLLNAIVKLKKETRVKLPDAIIVASSIKYKAKLITADTQILNQWPGQTVTIPVPSPSL